jgi:2-methylcitrate dehydratase PrpD
MNQDRTRSPARGDVRRLVRRFARLRAAQVPPRVLRKITLCLLDAVGNMVAGSTLPEACPDGGARREGDGEGAHVFGRHRSAPLLAAAFANAVHLDLLEAQDGHRRAGLHPCEGAIPAALALGGKAGRAWQEVLLAALAGYEVTLRFGMSLFPAQARAGYYPDGTCCPMGAAFTAGRLLSLDERALLGAIAAAAFASPLSLRQGVRGPAKSLIAGIGAEVGLRSALWAAEGLGGAEAVFEPPDGFLQVLSGHAAVGHLIPPGPPRWETEGVYLKPYPGGRHAHGAVDAIRRLLGQKGPLPGPVTSAEVTTYSAAVAFTGAPPGPGSPLAELTQSIPYLVALTLLDGAPDPGRFGRRARRDPAVLRLSRRVKVRSDRHMDLRYPEVTPTRVTLRFRSGTVWTKSVDHRWGDPEDPMSVEAVRRKFVRSARSVTREREAGLAWDRVWRAGAREPAGEVLTDLWERLRPLRP